MMYRNVISNGGISCGRDAHIQIGTDPMPFIQMIQHQQEMLIRQQEQIADLTEENLKLKRLI